jgi:hypothetical protein
MTVGELLAALTKMVDDSNTDENYWGAEPNQNKITYETEVVNTEGNPIIVAAVPDSGDEQEYIPNSVRVYIEEA